MVRGLPLVGVMIEFTQNGGFDEKYQIYHPKGLVEIVIAPIKEPYPPKTTKMIEKIENNLLLVMG